MQISLQDAISLVEKNKIKKALVILKKINKRSNQQSFESLHLEGFCLIQTKQFILAELILKQSLNKSNNDQQKLLALKNLQNVSYNLQHLEDTCEYLQSSLTIDSSLNNAQARYNLCTIANQIKRHDLVVQYADKLLTVSEFAHSTLFLLLGAYAAIGDEKQLSYYLEKLTAEINHITPSQCNSLFDFLYLQKATSKQIDRAFLLVKNKYEHEKWFQSFLLMRNNKIVESIELPTKLIEEEEIPNKFIIGTDPTAVNLIRLLISQLKLLGASFHPNLKIYENNGDLSIKCFSTNPSNQSLLTVPIKSMPMLDDYNLVVKDHFKLELSVKKNITNTATIPIMKSIIDIYNQTKKLQSWAESQPFITLKAAPELIEILVSLRCFNPRVKFFKQLYDQQSWDELLLNSFLESRRFGFTSEQLNLTSDSDQPHSVLLNIIDFLNHNSNASGYSVNQQTGFMEIKAQPDPDTHEVFVKYNQYDPVITFLGYGFIEKSPPFLYSCPVKLTTPSGYEINVYNNLVLKKGLLDQQNSHIQNFIPSEVVRENNTLIVSTLMIPLVAQKETLIQVLEYVLLKHDHENLYDNKILLTKEVEHLEKQITVFNLDLWRDFKKEIKKVESTNVQVTDAAYKALYELCDFSIDHINAYMHARGISVI